MPGVSDTPGPFYEVRLDGECEVVDVIKKYQSDPLFWTSWREC
jgi:hypothetical protein